ncbi:hypothetical protein CANARDRAFT_188601, partial [[Candida] arabinofermentans NRRL YB-2248]
IYRILGKIYLSGFDPILKQLDLSETYGITHILSVTNDLISPKYNRSPYRNLQISITDELSTNIIEHFSESNRFINDALFGKSIEAGSAKGLKHQGGVLIHCNAGISRSVSYLVAYLMKYYDLPLQKSIYAVKRQKKNIEPNESFINQLEFYHRVGCIDNVDTLMDEFPEYRQLSVNLLTAQSDIRTILENDKFFNTDDTNEDQDADGEAAEIDSELRCKRCRHTLCKSNKYIAHIPPMEDDSVGVKQGYFIKTAYKSRRIIDIQKGSTCTHHFIEPIVWMKDELMKGELEGKFNCPKCEAKVGGYSWRGSRCSCGKWMIPAIHLQKAKVDQAKIVPLVLPNLV